MAKSSVVLLALSALAVQSAVLKTEDALKRVARSPCDTCGPLPPPPPPPGFPPPPPPPLFRTQQWSGLARSADGRQQGVYSGAAAAAQNGPQATGEAFSIASAVGGASGSAGAGSEAAAGGAGFNGGYGGQNFGDSKYKSSGSYKESQYSYQSGGKHFEANGGGSKFSGSSKSGSQGNGEGGNYVGGGYGSQSNAQSGAYTGNQHGGFSDNEQQQLQSGSFGNGQNSFSGQHSHSGEFNQGSGQNSGFSNSQSSAFSNQGQGGSKYRGGLEGVKGSYGGNHQYGNSGFNSQSQSGAESGQYSKQRQVEGIEADSQWQSGHGSNSVGLQGGGKAGISGEADAQSALGGALNLASQGLQTAQHQSGCSTCGKSSYALSNAKSNSGSAIALSIGG